MNENFCSFLIAQQDETKAIIPKCISYHYSFRRCWKTDLFANKNSKYLFYKFNDQIEALGGDKRIIQHTEKMKDSLRLKKIEERGRQVLVEKIMHSIEYSNPYQNPTEKKNRLLKLLKVNIKYPGEFTRPRILMD